MKDQKNSFWCSAGLHKYVQNYDPMYDEHSRTCQRCGKKQYAKTIMLEIKWQDKPIKRKDYTRNF